MVCWEIVKEIWRTAGLRVRSQYWGLYLTAFGDGHRELALPWKDPEIEKGAYTPHWAPMGPDNIRRTNLIAWIYFGLVGGCLHAPAYLFITRCWLQIQTNFQKPPEQHLWYG
jgi:hypothetical protein